MNAQVKGAASFEIPEGRTVTVAKTAGFCFGVERAILSAQLEFIMEVDYHAVTD